MTPRRNTPPVLCQWYALCDRPAIGRAEHPTLGPVPICRRCAERHTLTLDVDLAELMTPAERIGEHLGDSTWAR